MPDYGVFGLRIRSELPLDELLPADVGEADAAIGYGAVPAWEGEREGINVEGASEALLVVPGVARYAISDGRKIVVEPASGASERNIRLYLLGSAVGALLHQRGLLPLHANAIEIEGRAIAFMGHPGAGKSTMAAWFLDRGYRVLADDVCVVTWNGDGEPIAHGGIPRLRLWREALEASGRTSDGYERSFDDMDKYNVPTPQASAAGPPVPLDHVYLLAKAEEGSVEGGIERLAGVAGIDALVANTYRGQYVTLMGAGREHLGQCLRLAGRAPVFRASRRWGYDRFDQEAAALEAHARALISARRSR